MKKLCAVLLALVLTLSLSVAAFAATNTATLTVTDDRTYDVYQIFVGDLDESTLSNIKWGKNGTGTTGTAVAKSVLDALVAVSGKSDTEKLAEITKHVNLSSEKFGQVSKTNSLSVPTGYYLLKDVTEDVGTGNEHSAFVVKIVGNTTVTAKAGQVTSEKKVQDVNDTTGETSGWQDSADYDIGDDVPFQLTGTVSAKYDAYTSYFFCFHDTLSDGLTFNEDSVEVYVDGTKITSGYTVVTEGLSDGCTFEVKFDNLKSIAAVKANSVIKVTYTATLNEGAAVGSTGNSNSMKLEYSNNPNDSTETGKTPEDKVTVFTYKLIINKVDDQSTPPDGRRLYPVQESKGRPRYVDGSRQRGQGRCTDHLYLDRSGRRHLQAGGDHHPSRLQHHGGQGVHHHCDP